jgi:hypothetical protein
VVEHRHGGFGLGLTHGCIGKGIKLHVADVAGPDLDLFERAIGLFHDAAVPLLEFGRGRLREIRKGAGGVFNREVIVTARLNQMAGEQIRESLAVSDRIVIA